MSPGLPLAFPWRRWLAPVAGALEELRNPPMPPARIRAAIAESERTSEILVAWVQLAGVAVFAVLYLSSLAAFEGRMGVGPVPALLFLYACFVAWRMQRAYARKLSTRMLSFSAAADVTVMMAAIWAFTLQYGAPPALYLKAPTLLYVFILIALRALRYDAGHVLLTGVLAAIGWSALVAIAAAAGAPVTGDYLVYMSSLSLLWGAELEKIAAILAVTAVLALAVARARALLVRTAVEETAARDLSRFLDRSAARRVRGAAEALKAGDGELVSAAIMFLDLRGFSAAAANLPPKQVIALLEDYQRRFVPIIEAAGGAVDKYLGDGILVSFGTAQQSARACADAIAAVPALRAAADTWAAERAANNLMPLEVAVAITAGEVVHGVVGSGDRLEYTVIGDAVNVAAKLEKHAKLEAARVIATKEALDRAQAQGVAVAPLRLVRAAPVEGVASPMDLAILA